MTTIPKPGDRIRLVAMQDDPDPIQVGQTGTVARVHRVEDDPVWHQIAVAWDNGRTLMLVVPPDRFEIIEARSSEGRPRQPTRGRHGGGTN